MRPLEILRSLTVLYVEDDDMQRQQMGEILQTIFQRVLSAENGAAGIALFTSQPVHVVIADLRMPVMDGLDMAGEIRRLDPKVPIMITSAYAETGDLLAAVRLRFMDYLMKPLSWTQLKDTLDKCAENILETGRYFRRLSAETFFCPINGKVLRNHEEVPLTAKERVLLALLVAHCGTTVHRERIIQMVYQDEDEATDSALKNLVMKLRRKIGEGSIVNSYGEGYMLRAYEADS